MELRVATKYSHIKKLLPKQIHSNMSDTLGDNAPSNSVVTKWWVAFKHNRSNI